ncbi:hypothetical protein H0H93_004079 [Arthromyces matolae]|nr:hypothetical protein H0H93_004079 [Arthromyces matolae]
MDRLDSDVMKCICQYLPRPTLYRLAQVSRNICDLALYRLWSHLPNALPLLKLVATPCPAELNPGHFIFSCDGHEDWLRFLYYSRLVRRIKVLYPQNQNNWDVYLVAPGTYSRLQHFLGQHLSFPSLLTIDLPLEGRYDALSASSFYYDWKVLVAGGKIADLSLTQAGHDPDRSVFFMSPFIHPHVLKLDYLTSITLEGSIQWEVVDFLATHRSIRFLYLGFLSSFKGHVSLNQLLKLQNLETLHIVLPHGTSFFDGTFPAGEFEWLTSLAIQAPTMSCFQALCNISPNIQILTLSQSSENVEGDWHGFFVTLAQTCHYLAKFQLTFKPHITGNVFHIYPYIEPLLSLRLECLILRGLEQRAPFYRYRLSDGELKELGSRLAGQLRSVEIFSECDYVDPGPTREGLFAMVRKCKLLHHIALSIHGEEFVIGKPDRSTEVLV